MIRIGFVLAAILPLMYCADLTLKQVFQESRAAMDSNKTEKMMDVLSKYYFTTIKENSIWYLAQEESMEVFGLEIEMDSLLFFETLLKRLAGHFQHCASMTKGVERAQCFSDCSPMLKDTEKGARWHTDPDVEVGEKAKFGALYNSVTAMSALVSVVARDNIEYFDNPHEKKEKIHRFSHVIYKMISDLQGSNPFDHDVVEFRLDQITPVTICDITTHFWKEFEGSCETRWTTMAFDKKHSNQIKLRSNISGPPRIVETEGGDKAKDTEPTIPENEESRDTVEDEGIDKSTLIGGDLGPSKKRYRTTVIDSSNDKVVYESNFIADGSSRGGMMDDATKEGLDARGKEEVKVKEQIMAHINGTFYINMKILRASLDLLKV